MPAYENTSSVLHCHTYLVPANLHILPLAKSFLFLLHIFLIGTCLLSCLCAFFACLPTVLHFTLPAHTFYTCTLFAFYLPFCTPLFSFCCLIQCHLTHLPHTHTHIYIFTFAGRVSLNISIYQSQEWRKICREGKREKTEEEEGRKMFSLISPVCRVFSLLSRDHTHTHTHLHIFIFALHFTGCIFAFVHAHTHYFCARSCQTAVTTKRTCLLVLLYHAWFWVHLPPRLLPATVLRFLLFFTACAPASWMRCCAHYCYRRHWFCNATPAHTVAHLVPGLLYPNRTGFTRPCRSLRMHAPATCHLSAVRSTFICGSFSTPAQCAAFLLCLVLPFASTVLRTRRTLSGLPAVLRFCARIAPLRAPAVPCAVPALHACTWLRWLPPGARSGLRFGLPRAWFWPFYLCTCART